MLINTKQVRLIFVTITIADKKNTQPRLTDIQNLMGVLAYLPYGVHTSPYKKLFDPLLWTEICEVFMKDACALLGFSVESPLSVW